MSGNFHETYNNDHKMPSERSTGLVFAGVGLLAALLYRHNPTVLLGGAAAFAGFTIAALFAPRLLRLLNIAWFKLSLLMGRIMNPIIMGILFALAIVPAGLVVQRLSDPLKRHRNPAARSYWTSREAGSGPGSMRRQF